MPTVILLANVEHRSDVKKSKRPNIIYRLNIRKQRRKRNIVYRGKEWQTGAKGKQVSYMINHDVEHREEGLACCQRLEHVEDPQPMSHSIHCLHCCYHHTLIPTLHLLHALTESEVPCMSASHALKPLTMFCNEG